MNTALATLWAVFNVLFLNSKPLNKLVRNKKGQGVIFALITMMVMIVVAIYIIVALTAGIIPDSTWSAQANTTWTNTQANIWLALGLLVIGIIIMGAVAILGFLRGGTGRGV